MTSKVEPLQQNFLPSDLEPLLAENRVTATVIVQAHQSLDEARWLLGLARSTASTAGVVTWAGLTSPNLGADLDELQKHPKFKGVRHLLHDEPDERWMLQADVLRGLRELEKRHIPYDLLVRPQHLKYVPELCGYCPELRLVIDHIAKPRIAEKQIDLWERDIEQVAQLPNIWCKLSGLTTEADWHNWTPSDLQPYVTHVVRCFGYDRVMFGSDWPVCTLAGSYRQTVDALKEVLGTLSDENSAKVWSLHAREFYLLPWK